MSRPRVTRRADARWWPLLILLVPLALPARPPLHLAPHRLFRVVLDGAFRKPVSGRLLLFATSVPATGAAGNPRVTSVDVDPFRPARTAVAAMEVTGLAPGEAVLVDADAVAFPEGFSKLAAGRYEVQAVLDVHHDYAYSGRTAGDLASAVHQVAFDAAATIPTLRLTRVLTRQRRPWRAPQGMPAHDRDKLSRALAAARPHSRPIDFVSPALTAFWGRPIHMHGWVLLPPGYDRSPGARYPTVYFTHGFGRTLADLTFTAAWVWASMADGAMPPMIWVLLDEHTAAGTVEFADSVNNGPWGTALTSELIPYLESRYRMDAIPRGRLLTGHSSGGWATLWLQVRYPKLFGGTWSVSPDPSDFHNFVGVDLYAPGANVYRRPDGSAVPLARADGKVVATFQQVAQLERVLGTYGGQMASFDWVFSPRAPDGRPQPMFNRTTGAVNPRVVSYWRQHYDIAYRIRTHWSALERHLDGKLHVIVGTADTFYLNESAQRLKAVLEQLGAHAEVQFLPGKTHANVYANGKDPEWLAKQIAWAMYHVARPSAPVPAADRYELPAYTRAADTAVHCARRACARGAR